MVAILDHPALDRREQVLLSLLPAAGEILERHFQEKAYAHVQKAGVDFTTAADMETDSFLRAGLGRAFPDCDFLTEETAPPDPTLLAGASDLWVIDPLDGTINFSRGVPHFAISVAWVCAGLPHLGAIYLPLSRDLYLARSDGTGARKNGIPIHVATTAVLRQCTVACDWSWDVARRKNVIRYLDALCPHIRQIKSMGSAVADLAQLAEGRIDAYVHSGLKPWDVSAASLLVTQAGGRITTPQGDRWSIFEPDLLAGTPTLHPAILQLISPRATGESG